MTILFAGYNFDFVVLKTRDYYRPLDLSVAYQSEGVVAIAEKIGCAAATATNNAYFEARFQRTSQGNCWQASVVQPELVKGIKMHIGAASCRPSGSRQSATCLLVPGLGLAAPMRVVAGSPLRYLLCVPTQS